MVAFRPRGSASHARRPNSKKHWTPEEDAILTTLVQNHGAMKWEKIASHIQGRSGRSCRTRWLNQLSPDLNKRPFSVEEKRKLLQLHEKFGNKWSLLVRFFPGRTDNRVKNEYHMLVAAMNAAASSIRNDPDGHLNGSSGLSANTSVAHGGSLFGASSSVCGRNEGSTQVGAPPSTQSNLGPHPHWHISSGSSMISDANTADMNSLQFFNFLGVGGLDEN